MHRLLTYKEASMEYQRLGTGPAVVLLHGFGEDASVWDLQKDALAQHFQLFIPNLPGTGPSGLLSDMRIEALADAVYAMLETEDIKACVLIGHSMGGYITLAFAEKYSAVLKGFGLFHSSAYADTDEKVATRKKGIQFIKDNGAHHFLKTATPNLYSPATKEAAPALIEKHITTTASFSNEALIAFYEAMISRPDRTEVLRRATVPVLFVLGRWDTAVPFEDSLAQTHLPQLAYIHVLEHSGHMGMVEEPERSTAILNQYLSETLG